MWSLIKVDIHWFQFIHYNKRTNERLTEKIIKVSLKIIIIKFKKNPKHTKEVYS